MRLGGFVEICKELKHEIYRIFIFGLVLFWIKFNCLTFFYSTESIRDFGKTNNDKEEILSINPNQEDRNDYLDEHEELLDMLSPDDDNNSDGYDDEWDSNEEANEEVEVNEKELNDGDDDDEWDPNDDEEIECEKKAENEEEINNEEDENESSGSEEEYTPRRRQRNFKGSSEGNHPFVCSFCGKGYPNEHGLSVHIGRSHGKETRKEKYVCEVEGCGKVFGWKCTFKIHMAKHAANSISGENSEDISELKKSGNIDEEELNNEDDKNKRDSNAEENENERTDDEEDESSDADDYTPSRFKRRKQRKFMKNLPFRCTFCQMRFPNDHGLSVHIGRSHGKETRKDKYVCEVEGCGNVYAHKHSLRNHMLKHEMNLISGESRKFKKNENMDEEGGPNTNEDDIGSEGDLPFSCSFCGTSYPNEHGLSVHIGRSHGKETRKDKYVCEVEGCGNVYAHKHSYRNHMARHATNSISEEKLIDLSKLKKNENTQKIVCSVEGCGMEFARIQTYKIHIKKHEKVRKLTCEICGKTFHHQSSLIYHLGAHERNTVPATLDHNPKSGRGRGRPVENFRPKHPDDPSTIILKEEIIPREKKKEIFKCKFCERVFKNNRALTVHKGLLHKDLVNKRENFVCSVQGCGKVYEHYQRQYYRLHMARHRKETRFKCLICGKEFYQQCNFLYHKQVHKRKAIAIPVKPETDADNINSLAEELPIFKCKFCDLEFPNKGQLAGHVRSHLGFKPKEDHTSNDTLMHICDICGKSFKQLKYLKKHKLCVHENKWAFYCEICGKGMGARQHLRIHMRVSHKIFEEGVVQYNCSVEGCRRKFFDERRYEEHMKELHPSGGEGDLMPFTCEHCGRGFWILNRWKEHLLTHKFVEGKRNRNKIVME